MLYNELRETLDFLLDTTPQEIIAGVAAGIGLWGLMFAVCKIVVLFA